MIYRAHRRRDGPHADGRLGFIFSRVASGESRSMAASCRCYWHCLTRYAEQGLCNCWASVRPSVSLSHLPAARRYRNFAAVARPAGDIDRLLHGAQQCHVVSVRSRWTLTTCSCSASIVAGDCDLLTVTAYNSTTVLPEPKVAIEH